MKKRREKQHKRLGYGIRMLRSDKMEKKNEVVSTNEIESMKKTNDKVFVGTLYMRR